MANYWLDYKVISVVYCSLLRYTDLIIRNAFAQRYREFDTLPLLLCTLYKHYMYEQRTCFLIDDVGVESSPDGSVGVSV